MVFRVFQELFIGPVAGAFFLTVGCKLADQGLTIGGAQRLSTQRADSALRAVELVDPLFELLHLGLEQGVLCRRGGFWRRASLVVLLVGGVLTVVTGIVLMNSLGSFAVRTWALWIHAALGLVLAPIAFLWHTMTGVTSNWLFCLSLASP